MTKQYIIRHKETHKQLFTSRGKKGAWKTAGHAKAAFTNFMFYSWHAVDYGVNFRGNIRFDDQEVFEVVEVVPVEAQQLQVAEMLLSRAYSCLGNADYDLNLSKDIHDYFGAKSNG
ncbi:hypothetical protein D3C75_640270 [compost metagenome]